MMRCVFLCMLMGSVTSASAVGIKTYQTRLDVTSDGSATATVNVHLTNAQAGVLTLPLAFTSVDGFAMLDAPPGVVVKPIGSKDQSAVVVTLPPAVAPDARLGFRFNVSRLLVEPKPEAGQKSVLPAGTRLLRYTFVNTQSAIISTYRVEVKLPERTQVHVIREQSPKTGRKEFVPRVELVGLEGHQGAVLQLANLKLADRTSMELEVVDTGRTYLWLLIGLVLSLGYLIAFRDLLKHVELGEPHLPVAADREVVRHESGIPA